MIINKSDVARVIGVAVVIYLGLLMLISTLNAIDKSMQNKTLMLCKSALYSENKEWLKNCECFYATNEIACVKH